MSKDAFIEENYLHCAELLLVKKIQQQKQSNKRVATKIELLELKKFQWGVSFLVFLCFPNNFCLLLEH